MRALQSVGDGLEMSLDDLHGCTEARETVTEDTHSPTTTHDARDGAVLDLISFGEGLVDWFPTTPGRPLEEVETIQRAVGGAPVNLAMVASKLGARAAMMSCFGDDAFGRYLRGALEGAGVDVEGVRLTKAARTGITFVELGPNGERSFLFYRFHSAEKTIQASDINPSVLRRARVVACGSNLLMFPGPSEANHALTRDGRALGALVAMDANIRAHLWPDRAQIVPSLMDLFAHVDLLKANDDEFDALFGDMTPERAYAERLAPLGVRALVVTRGPEGAEVITASGLHVHAPAPEVEAIDTTGAGDAFLASLLLGLSKVLPPGLPTPDAPLGAMLDRLTPEAWRALLGLANRVASSVCTRVGATTAVPPADTLPWERTLAAHRLAS